MKYKNFKKGMKTLLHLHVFLLTNCDSILTNPKGQIAFQQRSLIITAFFLMLLVVIPSVLLTLIFSWKYRNNNALKTSYNPNWCHSNKLEFFIWFIPILIIVFLAFITWKSTNLLDPGKKIFSKNKSITIEVVSLDWKWLFIYPNEKIATINQLVFPKNTPIHFKITSNTVMNSFFIPKLGSQIYAMSGMQTKLYLIANDTGIFNGISSNFSGKGFSTMQFQTIVTNKNNYTQWIKKIKKSSKTLTTLESFDKIQLPSVNHPIEFFSFIHPDLFNIFGKIKK